MYICRYMYSYRPSCVIRTPHYRVYYNHKYPFYHHPCLPVTPYLLPLPLLTPLPLLLPKLSQILGHSEQLYVKLPRGLRVWQFVTTSLFVIVSLWVTSSLHYAIDWVGVWVSPSIGDHEDN